MNSKMNSTNCTTNPQHISIPVFTCLTIFVGALLSFFSLWVFTCRTPVWKSGTVLQFHLAISDVIMCPMAPFIAIYFYTGDWIFGSFLCRLNIALINIHFYTSILFLTLISVHRYMAVVHYDRDSYMNRKDFVRKLCAGVWLFMLIKGAFFVAIFDTSKVNNHTLCFSIHQADNMQVYFIINFIVLLPEYLLAFTASVFCYTRLVRSVSHLNSSHDNGRAIKNKSYKMVTACLIIFVVCFTPIHLVFSLAVVVKKYFSHKCNLLLKVETVYYVSWILAQANSCFNPIIYCFSSQKFTKAIHISLRRIGFNLETGQGETLQGCCQATRQPH